MPSFKSIFLAVAGFLIALSGCHSKSDGTPKDKSEALRLAAEEGDLDAVRGLLRDGAQVNKPNRNGKTALHYAAQCKNVSVANALIQAGADVNAKMSGDVTPLMLSVDMAFGDPDIALLLIHSGADVNMANEKAETALIIASTESSDEVVRILLEKGANPNARGLGGETALHMVAMNAMIDRARLLLGYGADASIRDLSGKSPQDVAVTTNPDPRVQTEFRQMRALLLNNFQSSPIEPPPIVFLKPKMSLAERKSFLAADFKPVRKVNEIPAAVLARYTLKNAKKVAMANPGEKYQATDLVEHPLLPWRRLVFADVANDKVFVEYEHGGIGEYTVIDMFEMKSPEVAEGLWRGTCFLPVGTLDELRKQISDRRCE